MIQIKKNDYVQPTEIREEVVQKICDSFLRGHGFTSNGYWATHYVQNDSLGFFNIRQTFAYPQKYTKIHEVEVKSAIRELLNAGYFMFKGYDCNVPVYKSFKCPVIYGYTQVTEINDFID